MRWTTGGLFLIACCISGKREDGFYENSSLNADPAFITMQEEIRTVWLALATIGIVSILKIGITVLSGSIVLLAASRRNEIMG
jgi:hypothetical protein